jgi:hypothetical protein
MTNPEFSKLINFLKKIPSISQTIGSGISENGNWWVKFSIDIKHNLAWQVVQELGHVINCLSVSEKLPACFYPVSAPPYLNGGPEDYLYWAIDSFQKDFSPDVLAEWLEGRLPNPVNDISQWEIN